MAISGLFQPPLIAGGLFSTVLYSFVHQGLVTVPFWEYWTSPKKVAMALTIYLMVG